MAQDLAGKVFLVTGATEGIGKAAAIEFASRGAALTLVGRNPEKTERVKTEIEAKSGTKGISVLLGDLSKVADVRAVAKQFAAKNDRLDVLINNAGALFNEHRLSADGFELTFALNHLAYFVLTNELLPLLQKTPGARVISTSSAAHFTGRIDLDRIAARPDKRTGFAVYGDTKLANVLFTRELARRAGPGVHCHAYHPGFVRSGFGQNNQDLMANLISMASSVVGRTTERGARTMVFLATQPEGAQSSGNYWADEKVRFTSPGAKDDVMAGKLWALSESLTAGK